MLLLKKLPVLFLICIGLSPSVNAQTALHDLTATFDQIELWKDYEFLIDSSSRMDVSQVMNSNRWERVHEIKNFGFTDVTVWARYHVKTAKGTPESYLVPQTVTMDSIHFFIVEGDSILVSEVCGDHIDYDTRPIEFQACAFLLPKSDSTQTIYLRFNTSGPLTLPVTVREKKHFQKNIFYETYLYGIHFGLFLLVSIYHLVLFLFLRERTLLLYAIYVLVAGIVGTVVNGLLTQLFFRTNGEAIDGLMILLTGISVFFYSWFVSDFLLVKKRSPKLYFALLLMMGLGLLLVVAHFIMPLAQTSAPAGLISLVAHTLVLITTLYFFIKGYQDTGLLLIASTIFLVTAIMFALRVVGAIPVNFLTENGIEIGAALEVILISISLGSRFRRTAIEKQSLTALSEFKESMTSMIVHDLKNPLGVILGTESEKPSIRNMAGQMLSLVNNMLDVQKFEKAEVKLKLATVGVSQLVVEAVEQVRTLMEEKNVTVQYKLSEGMAVQADWQVLLRVMVNLLTNAIKYSPTNGSITLNAQLKDRRVIFNISDEGPGIPEDQQDAVFEAYQQIDPKKSGKVGSTGLGLTFCKLALQAHGSEILVSSKIGEGTTFSFALNADASAAVDSIASEEEKPELTRKERDLILKLIPTLRTYGMHQAMQMESLLEPVSETSEASKKWVEAILNAAYSGNEAHFDELVESVEKD